MKSGLDLSIVVAMTPDRVIGDNLTLPWRKIPSDMRRFRNLTLAAHNVIMGRKTFQSIVTSNGEALKNRNNIVLTRSGSLYVAVYDGHPAHSVEEALAPVEHGAAIIGGGEIYKLFLPLVNTLYVTIVHTKVAGTVLFPEIDESEWQRSIPVGPARHDSRDPYETSFVIYKRT